MLCSTNGGTKRVDSRVESTHGITVWFFGNLKYSQVIIILVFCELVFVSNFSERSSKRCLTRATPKPVAICAWYYFWDLTSQLSDTCQSSHQGPLLSSSPGTTRNHHHKLNSYVFVTKSLLQRGMRHCHAL